MIAPFTLALAPLAGLAPLAPPATGAQQTEAFQTQDDLGDRITPAVRVVQRVAPAVAFITTDITTPVRTFRGIYEQRQQGSGSGVVIYDDGYIVTNYHVVRGADAGGIRVKFDPTYDATTYVAQLISFVEQEDLALLKISRDEPFTTVPLGISDDLMIAEPVLAIGNPLGHSNTVSMGIISGLHRNVNVGELAFTNLIQTDASINQGNSGGPLLNIRGELIGINSAFRMGAENIGFAIPVNRVKAVLEDSLRALDSAQAWLGYEVDLERLEVTRVVSGSPADIAGLRVGDRVKSIGDSRVDDEERYRLAHLSVLPHTPVRLGYRRAGDSHEALLEPWSRVDGILYDRAGMTVEQMLVPTQYPGRYVRLIRVSRIRPGGPADRLGLRPNDLVDGVRATGRPPVAIGSPQDFALFMQRLTPGTGLEVDIWRDENQNGVLEVEPVSERFHGRLTVE
jgi:serine protease Do